MADSSQRPDLKFQSLTVQNIKPTPLTSGVSGKDFQPLTVENTLELGAQRVLGSALQPLTVENIKPIPLPTGFSRICSARLSKSNDHGLSQYDLSHYFLVT